MPLPFILGGLALAAAGYGVKKGIDALDADCEADEFIKKAEGLKEEAAKRLESAQSDCKLALARFGEKKLHVLSHTVPNFLDHFHRLKRSTITIEGINTQDIQRQVSDVQKITNQYREVDFLTLPLRLLGALLQECLRLMAHTLGRVFSVLRLLARRLLGLAALQRQTLPLLGLVVGRSLWVALVWLEIWQCLEGLWPCLHSLFLEL